MSDGLGVPPFTHDDLVIDIIKDAGRAIGQFAHLSRSRQAIDITQFATDHGRGLQVYHFRLSKQQWCQFLSEEKEIRHVPGSPNALKIAWHWMFSAYPDIIGPIFRNAGIERKLPNPVAPTLYEWLSGKADFAVGRLRGLAGRYAVYRPHFLDPDTILVSEMMCGVDGDPSRFTIEMQYRLAGEVDPVEETVEGYIVPYHECVLFQGKIARTGAPFIFILSGFPLTADGSGYHHSDGALLVGATGSRPSAYPIVIWRIAAPFVPYAATREELASSLENWREIKPILDRGIVDWR